MTLAELRELCERDCGEDFAAGILADEQIAAAARTRLPALIEMAETAHQHDAHQDRCSTCETSLCDRGMDALLALHHAVARLDEAGK
mgnify:CR=1 FL=1